MALDKGTRSEIMTGQRGLNYEAKDDNEHDANMGKGNNI